MLGWPFISDDYIFLDETREGTPTQLFLGFHVAQNYFRPLGRELYFYSISKVLGNRPLAFRLLNLAILIASVGLVTVLGWRLAGHRAGILAGAVYALLYMHRVLLAWVSCSQDLIATLMGLMAVHLYLRERPRLWLSAVSYFVGLFAKESIAVLPAVMTAWAAWSPGKSWRRPSTWRNALGRTWRFWLAAAVWAAVVLGIRVWKGIWVAGEGIPVADVTLEPGKFLEGLQSALLSYVYLDQPLVYLKEALQGLQVPWVPMLMAAVVALLAFRISPDRKPEVGREGPLDRGASLRLGGIWALVAAVPIAFAGHHFSAYYVSFAAAGFALFASWSLPHHLGVVEPHARRPCSCASTPRPGASGVFPMLLSRRWSKARISWPRGGRPRPGWRWSGH